MPKNGLILIKPTTVDKTGTGSTATINTNGSVSFTDCQTLSLNGVFSANYDNYMIMCWHSASAFTGFDTRVRSNGTDSTATTDYNHQQLYASSTTVSADRVTDRGSWSIGRVGGAQRGGHAIWLYGPFLSQPTAYRSIQSSDLSNAALFDLAGTHELSTSYDGLTFIIQSPYSFSGRVAVYGMRN